MNKICSIEGALLCRQERVFSIEFHVVNTASVSGGQATLLISKGTQVSLPRTPRVLQH